MRRGKRVDSTHGEVRDALKAAGWGVLDTHDYPSFVDLVAWKGDTVRLIDAKGPKTKLSPAQAKLVARGCPIVFIRTKEEAVNLR